MNAWHWPQYVVAAYLAINFFGSIIRESEKGTLGVISAIISGFMVEGGLTAALIAGGFF